MCTPSTSSVHPMKQALVYKGSCYSKLAFNCATVLSLHKSKRVAETRTEILSARSKVFCIKVSADNCKIYSPSNAFHPHHVSGKENICLVWLNVINMAQFIPKSSPLFPVFGGECLCSHKHLPPVGEGLLSAG